MDRKFFLKKKLLILSHEIKKQHKIQAKYTGKLNIYKYYVIPDVSGTYAPIPKNGGMEMVQV